MNPCTDPMIQTQRGMRDRDVKGRTISSGQESFLLGGVNAKF